MRKKMKRRASLRRRRLLRPWRHWRQGRQAQDDVTKHRRHSLSRLRPIGWVRRCKMPEGKRERNRGSRAYAAILDCFAVGPHSAVAGASRS